jgi:hypothetical protein
MKRVFDTDAVAVYENEEAVPEAYEPGARIMLRDWGQVLALAQRTSLLSYLIQVRHAGPGPVDMPATAAVHPVPAATLVRSVGSSPVSRPVTLQSATRTVVITNPAYTGWQLAGFRTTSQFGVTAAFTDSAGLGHPATLVATYGPWRLVHVWDVVGACLAAADMALLAIVLIRSRRRTGREAAGDVRT